jgi:predicted amidohydrolase YtcJ
MTGESSYFLDLKDCPSMVELQARLRAHLQAHPTISFVQGVNWDQESLGRYPTRQDLDEVRITAAAAAAAAAATTTTTAL